MEAHFKKPCKCHFSLLNLLTWYAINSNHINSRCITIRIDCSFMRAINDPVFCATAIKSAQDPVISCAIPKMAGSRVVLPSSGKSQHPTDNIGGVDVPGTRGVISSSCVTERSAVVENLTATKFSCFSCGSEQAYICQQCIII